MSDFERNFADYQLGDDVYHLGRGLLPEMARVMEYDLGITPTEEALQGFVGHIGPARWLQDNIEVVRGRLGYYGQEKDSVMLAADWTEQSGVMEPVHRSFASPEITLPGEFDVAVITGGVGRWMLRRAAHLRDLFEVSGVRMGEAVVAAGTRQMKESEHALVADLAARQGHLPTESEFAHRLIVPRLQVAGIRARALDIGTHVGDEVMKEAAYAIQNRGTILSVANAPAAIQTAGQLRVALRDLKPDFDASGEQLFVSADAMPVARHGESPATHQNPYTALGQIARNALFVHRNNMVQG